MKDIYKNLYTLSDKCAKLQTKNILKAEETAKKIDSEVVLLKENGASFDFQCGGEKYRLPIKWKNLEYFRPLFKMETHRLLKEVSADDSNALDLDIPAGSEVYAVASGVVTALQHGSTEGGNDERFAGKDNYLYIYDDKKKLIFCYRHLEKFNHISLNDRVEKGDFLGKVGVTGFVITPHLHFAVYNVQKNKKIILKSLPIRFI